MPEKREDETPKAGVQRIDMRALERGVRKALAIKPKEQEGKRQAKQKGNAKRENPTPS